MCYWESDNLADLAHLLGPGPGVDEGAGGHQGGHHGGGDLLIHGRHQQLGQSVANLRVAPAAGRGWKLNIIEFCWIFLLYCINSPRFVLKAWFLLEIQRPTKSAERFISILQTSNGRFAVLLMQTSNGPFNAVLSYHELIVVEAKKSQHK